MLSHCCKLQLLRATRPATVLRTASAPVTPRKFCIISERCVAHTCLPNIDGRFKRSFRLLKKYSTSSDSLTPAAFDKICEETLDSIAEYFEELAESLPELKSADIAYSDGVITAFLGDQLGTYVINRQTPNQQIWLSSPTSGPKRYDFIDGYWIYKHDNSTLHSLLDLEIGKIVKQSVEFSSRCSFGKRA